MQRVNRPVAPARLSTYLGRRHKVVMQAKAAGTLNIERVWKTSRQTKIIGNTALGLLQSAMGVRERCMYCLDAHGTDIEHFWPKAKYPQRAFKWANWLLCCTECGRIKGSKFPLDATRQPLLIDPTVDDPWAHLDFDPDTGNMTAKYILANAAFSPKGEATVKVLELSQREALAAEYRKTYSRLVKVIESSISSPPVNGPTLLADLKSEDDHGLLPWCFHAAGQHLQPFSSLKNGHPLAWDFCANRV